MRSASPRDPADSQSSQWWSYDWARTASTVASTNPGGASSTRRSRLRVGGSTIAAASWRARSDIRFRRLVFPQPIGIVRVDDRGLAHLLARLSNLELPGDLHLFALVGGDSNDRAVRPGSSPGRGTTPMNPACARRREIRVDRGDVRAEHAVGEHALRIAIDQRCDVRDPIGRHCPTAHGKVAFGDDGPLSGDRTVDKCQDATTRQCGSVDFKGNDKVNRPVIECRDANDHLMPALWQTRNRESAFESAGERIG